MPHLRQSFFKRQAPKKRPSPEINALFSPSSHRLKTRSYRGNAFTVEFIPSTLRKVGGLALFALFFLCFPLLLPTAHAYLLTPSASGKPVRWLKQPIRWRYNHNNLKQLTSTQVLSSIQTALKIWQGPACAKLSFAYDGTTTERWDTQDNKNTIVWSNKIPDPQFDTALALTLLFYTRDGEMLDADIVLNSTYTWSLNPKPGEFDLTGALTHEFGHLLGMDHTTDKGAAMYARARPGICPCRSLQLDDVNALCLLYPATTSPTRTIGQSCDASKRCQTPLFCAPLTSGATTGVCLSTCQGSCAGGEPCVTLPGGQKACLCQTNDDCTNRRTCVDFQCNGPPILRKYGEVCAKDDPCDKGLTCVFLEADNTKGFCVRSCPDGKCVGGERCHQLDGGKTACYCEAQNECKKDSFCINYQCKEDDRISYTRKAGERCDNLRRCLKTLVCAPLRKDERQGWCLTPCTNNADCGGRCRKVNDDISACVCETSGDCRDGKHCRGYHCGDTPGAVGDRCGVGDSCGDTLRCQQDDAGAGLCVASSTCGEKCPPEHHEKPDRRDEPVADGGDSTKAEKKAEFRPDGGEQQGCRCEVGGSEEMTGWWWGLFLLWAARKRKRKSLDMGVSIV